MYSFIRLKNAIDVYFNLEYVGTAYGAKTSAQALKIILEA